jgi:hypothetical protein
MVTAAMACHSVTSCLPLYHALKWQPFRIDALGLVTMIGSEQVNTIIGRLVTSRYTEYLPLLGAFVLAGNQFTDAISGFELYNLYTVIKTTDLAGWFERWCLAQNFHRASNTVTWTVRENSSATIWRSRLDTLLAALIGIVGNGALVALTVLQGDWWGLANSLSMIFSILVRTYLTKQNRDALDSLAVRYKGADQKGCHQATFVVLLNDGKLVTMNAPPNLIKNCFIDKPIPPNKPLYKIMRGIGWISFTAHVITIGMSGLATQIVTVFLIVVPTVLTVFRIGCDDSVVGSRLKADISTTGQDGERRQDTYLALGLSDAEETSMVAWSLMPHKDNKEWWEEYNEKKRRRRLQNVQPTQHNGQTTQQNGQPATQNGHLAPQKVQTATTSASSLSSRSGASS